MTSQLSFKKSVLSRQSTHLLLQSSHCVFHWDRVGSHARAKCSKVKGQLVTSRHNQQPKDNLRLWNHHQQRVPHSFQRQPTMRNTLVPTVPDSQPNEFHTFNELRARSRFATHTHVLSEHRNKEQRTKDSTTLRYHVCRGSAVSCDNLCLTPVIGCAHMDDHRACRVTSVHTLSATTKRTENNKCSAVAYVDGQAQTRNERGVKKQDVRNTKR